ncbi:MAG: ABC transporter ATP-binding protein [Deltaproteobacteria bacterium]|nr:ABC transporter ATP-binding protein [Deltaproteobacteria bacterium]
MKSAIKLENYKKKYGDFTAVHDLNLEVMSGEIFGFLGPNGAGKTTTIKMLMGILSPSFGRGTIYGHDITTERVYLKKIVGYLPDNPTFYDYLKGEEILRFVGGMHGIVGDDLDEKVENWFRDFDLHESRGEFAVKYSTGMKKKLALGMAAIHNPRLLILDEPTAGLDPVASRKLQNWIVDYASQGNTIFLSSHLMDMVQKLCHRVAIIHEGRIAAIGTPEELKEKISSGGTLEDVFIKIATSNEVRS